MPVAATIKNPTLRQDEQQPSLVPDVVMSASQRPLNFATLDMLSYIQRHGSATFVDLERIAQDQGIPVRGVKLIGVDPWIGQNMAIWGGVSRPFINALQNLLGDVIIEPVDVSVYVRAGWIIKLPVGKPARRKPYVRTRWLPVVFRALPIAAPHGEGA